MYIYTASTNWSLHSATNYSNPYITDIDGKLITATMNPMDSQQQSTATKNFLQLLSILPGTWNGSNHQQHIPILMANKTIATKALLGFFFLKK